MLGCGLKEVTELAKQTLASLMRRLSSAGFKRDFVRAAVLPAWWDPSCEEDPNVLPDIEIRVARFVNAPLDVVRNPSASLRAPTHAGAQLRRVRNISKDRLGPAIHAAIQVAAATVRSARTPVAVRPPPSSPMAWRSEIVRPRPVLRLADIVADLWDRGIPVVHVEFIPSPAFQSLACIVEEDRPVIVLAHDLDVPARLAFIIAHEVGHIVNGDCAIGQPVVDEQEEVSDDHEIERRADAYATGVLTGGVPIPEVAAAGFKDLATKAARIEKESGVDAAAVVWSWARRIGDYPKATMAAQALYRARGGKRVLRAHFSERVDLGAASESDRALLRCLHGDPERDAAAG